MISGSRILKGNRDSHRPILPCFHPTQEGLLQRLRLNDSKQSSNSVVRWNAVSQLRKASQPLLLCVTILLNLYRSLYTAEYGTDGQITIMSRS